MVEKNLIDTNDLTVLSDASIKLGIRKSRLLYYRRIGLIKPIKKIGVMQMYSFSELSKTVKEFDKKLTLGIPISRIKK